MGGRGGGKQETLWAGCLHGVRWLHPFHSFLLLAADGRQVAYGAGGGMVGGLANPAALVEERVLSNHHPSHRRS